MQISILKISTITITTAIYFKFRKVTPEDQNFKIKLPRGRSLTIFRKDIINITLIAGSSILVIQAAKGCYSLIKAGKNSMSLSTSSSTSFGTKFDIDIKTISAQELDTSQRRKTIIIHTAWIIVVIGAVYYLGERIRIPEEFKEKSISDTPKPKPKLVLETFRLSWWDKLTLDPKLIKDISNENTFGEISRLVTKESEPEPILEPIKSSTPRRIVVWMFAMFSPAFSYGLGIKKGSSHIKGPKRPPLWTISPITAFIKFVYNRLNN